MVTWPLLATGAKDFTTDHGCNKAVDPDTATVQSRRSSQLQVAAQATWISMAPRAQTWPQVVTLKLSILWPL